MQMILFRQWAEIKVGTLTAPKVEKLEIEKKNEKMAVLSAAYAVCITVIVLEVVVIGVLAAYLKLPKPSESGKING